MENQKPGIEFYRQRAFSEKLNATFDFIRENWRPLLKYTFYLIMPICLVQTFAMNAFFNGYLDFVLPIGGYYGSSVYGFAANYGVLLFCALIGSALLSGLVYAMMQTYATRADRLQNLTLNDFKERLVGNVWKCLHISFFLIFVFIALVALAGLLAVLVSSYSLILTIPLLILFIICLIPFMLLVPVYLFERDITIPNALRKAWKLGTATLGGMIGLMIVLSIITSVIQTVTLLPWYITFVVGSILPLTTGIGMNQSVIYKFVLYIFGLIQTYGIYVSSIISVTGLAFQYFHAREKVEGVTIESNISNFDEL
jgi:MFS family permease